MQNPDRDSLASFSAKAVRKWHYFAISVGVGLLLAIGLVALLPKSYTATMIVGPTPLQSRDFSGAGGVLSSSSFLGTLASGMNTDFGAFIAILPTTTTAEQITEDRTLMAGLFPDSWDQESQNWVRPSGFLAVVKTTLKSWIGYPDWTPPNSEAVVRLMEKNLTIRSLNTPGYYKIQFDAKDADVAERLLWHLYDVADTTLKSHEKQRLAARISYLEEKIQSVRVSEYRQSLLNLLSQEEKRLLSTVEGLPYAAEMLSEPAAESIPSSPNILAFFLGLPLLGMAIALFIVNKITLGERPSPAETRQEPELD